MKIAVDMVKEGLLEEYEAIMRVEPKQLDQLLHPMIDPKLKLKVLAKGLPASTGAAVGMVVFTADEAEEWVKKGEKACPPLYVFPVLCCFSCVVPQYLSIRVLTS